MPGSGGQWVNYLLWCLNQGRVMSGGFDHFEFDAVLQRDPNYFTSVEFLEHTDLPSNADIVLGSDRAWMNFYANLTVKKNKIDDCDGVLNYIVQLQQKKINFNLDWCDLWQQPEKFLSDLGTLIGRKLPYDRIAKQAIAQYSRSCVWLEPYKLQNNQHLLLARHLRLAVPKLGQSYFYPEPLADPSQTGNYCPLIFNSLYVEKVNNGKVKLSACCINHTGEATEKIDFANNSHLQKQRDLSRRGLPVSGCTHCYHSTVNLQSNAIVSWLGRPIQHTGSKIQKLDYNVDPICNARCIQCSSYYSSAWEAEDRQHGLSGSLRQFGQTRRERPWQELDLDHVEQLYINGGEPLLSSEPQEILEHLAKNNQLSKLQFSFNTNGSVRPSAELIDLWGRCGGVQINFSIDGTESEFNYIRYPLVWEEVADNVEFCANLPGNINLSVAYTVGIHNIDCVDRTLQWRETVNSQISRPMGISVNLCSGTLDLTNAEPGLKQLWLSRYDGSQSWHHRVRGALLGPSNPQTQTWQEHLEMIDLRRGLDWRRSLPLLYQSWKLSQRRV